MENNIIVLIIAGIILLVNIFSFGVVLFDKMRSRRFGKRRVSEVTLFFLAAMFGGIGVYSGMLACRHKTRKWHFYIGIPVMVFQNICFVYLFYRFLLNLGFVL